MSDLGGLYIALVLFLLAVFLALPVALPIGALVARRRSRPRLAAVLRILSVITFIAYAYFAYFNLPLGDKRVAEIRTKNGTELVVHQTCNYSIEPYTTRFYYRISPSHQWQAFYMDHQDDRWFSGRIDFDEAQQKAIIRRGKKTVATFDLATLTFTRGTHATTKSWTMAEGAKPGDKIKN